MATTHDMAKMPEISKRVILALFAVAIMVAVPMFAANQMDEAESEEDSIILGESDIGADEFSEKYGIQGSYAFSDGTGVLNLNGGSFDTSAASCVSLSSKNVKNLTVNVNGENSLRSSRTDTNSFGIIGGGNSGLPPEVYCDITIKGNGTLTLETGNVSGGICYSQPIYAKNLVIGDGTPGLTVIAKAGSANFTSILGGGSTHSYGIGCDSLTINNATVRAESSSAQYSFGIHATYGASIADSDVTAIGQGEGQSVGMRLGIVESSYATKDPTFSIKNSHIYFKGNSGAMCGYKTLIVDGTICGSEDVDGDLSPIEGDGLSKNKVIEMQKPSS